MLRHSWCSSAATESATIPAPACTEARLPDTSMVRMAMAVSMLPEKST